MFTWKDALKHEETREFRAKTAYHEMQAALRLEIRAEADAQLWRRFFADPDGVALAFLRVVCPAVSAARSPPPLAFMIGTLAIWKRTWAFGGRMAAGQCEHLGSVPWSHHQARPESHQGPHRAGTKPLTFCIQDT